MAARYVVDASVLSHYLGTDTYTIQSRVLIARLAQGDELFVPEFCLLECTNILWKAARFRGMPIDRANQFIDELAELPLQIVPVASLLKEALQIGLAHELAVYDSLYIALALSLNCPLVTVDDRQMQAAIAQGSAIAPITDFSAVSPG